MSKNNNRILSLLGLASKARKIVSGDNVLKNIRNGNTKCVLIASDASNNTKKKYIDKCNCYNVPCYIFSDIENISKAIGKDNRVYIGINDIGFANKIISMLGG